VAVRVARELEPGRLARALAQLAERHEILRTTFELAHGGPEQRVHPPRAPAPPFATRGLGAATPAAPQGPARGGAARAVGRAREPAWRVALAPLGVRASLLVVTMHHIVSDGATMGLFLDELARAYEGAPLAPLALQFGDYAAWERAQLDEARAEEH